MSGKSIFEDGHAKPEFQGAAVWPRIYTNLQFILFTITANICPYIWYENGTNAVALCLEVPGA